MSSHSPKRPTVAFLVDNLLDAFEEALWTSVVAAARDEGIGLLCYLGGSIPPPGAELQGGWGRNAVYELVARENVDGVIALSNSIGCYVEDDRLLRLYARFDPLPILSLCRELPGIPSLVVDSRAGVRDLLDHLVVEHGRRRIAFIRGPATNTDAEERYRAYCEALRRHGLPLDPALIVPGDFQRPSGFRAVGALLDERSVRPDAVVAANDYMALYAMAELIRRGVDVPGEVAVAGFDDILDAGSAIPSLATVRQPLADLGRLAVHRISAMLRGEQVAPLEILPSRLVTRRSCGCHPALGARPDPSGQTRRRRRGMEPEARPPAPRSANELARIVERAAPELAERLQLPGWAGELAGALVAALDGPPGPFLDALERIVLRGLARGVDPARFHDVVHAALWVAGGRGEDERGAILAESSTRLIGDMQVHAQAALRNQDEEENKILRRIFLPVHLTEDGFREVLLRELPTLGVRSFFLARFASADGREAQLRMAYDLDGRVPAAPGAGTFPSSQLLAGGFRPGPGRAHAVLPLHYQDERIGYALCGLGPSRPSLLEPLTTDTSTVLKVVSLLEEVRRHASQLEAKVTERTRELRDAQRQLLETAHRAGMTEVAVGVLHNVGNLLNTVSVCAEQIAGHAVGPQADGLRKAARLLELHRSDLAGFLARDARGALLPEYLGRMAEGLDQDGSLARDEARQLLEKVEVIRDTIRALQDLAREGRGAVLHDSIELRAVIDAVLEIQTPLLQRHGVALERSIPGDLPAVVTDRAKLVHILVNVVKNGIEAMRSTTGERRLGVAVALDGAARVRLTVSDTGEGIAPEDLDRIFSYGFTTKPDGHGFGLHTCALYASQLGGSLTVRSPGPGRGASFTLELPRTVAPR